MARTAPAPNLAPIPGMCPGVAILDGGVDAGGGRGGAGAAGGGQSGGGAGDGGDDAGADQRCAPDYERYPECGYASHPVDVVTGRAFTHPITDLYLPGPLPLEFKRMYSSTAADRDVGLGHGWAHSFGWEVEVRRREIVIWNEQGVAVDFPMLDVGQEAIGPWGWLLRRDASGFHLDADDNVQRVFTTSADGDRRFRLTAIEDRRGNRISLTWDRGRLLEAKDSAGRVVRLAPTQEGQIRSIAVKNAIEQGRWIVFAAYRYDAQGDLRTVTDAEGCSWEYAYDDLHRLTSDTDRVGLAFHFVYDARGRCIESWGSYEGRPDPSLVEDVPKVLADRMTRAKGIHHCKFEYYDSGYVEVADSREVRRFFGNRHGLLDKRVEGGGVVTAIYDDRGQILARTDEMEATSCYERDERSRLLRETDPLGRVTMIERDGNGLPVRIVDPAGGETTLVRNRWGEVIAHVDAAGGSTMYAYDERGLPVAIVSPTGGRTKIEHDAHGNMVALTQSNGGVRRWKYDFLGRRIGETDPLGATTRFAWSDRGDLLSVYHHDGGVTRYEVDAEGRLTSIMDPGGRTIRLAWGGYHKLVAKTDGAGGTVRLRYNREGELVEVHNEIGEVHRLAYTPGGNLIEEATFDGRTLSYGYDLAGRMIWCRNGAREKTELVYNAAGELVERHLEDGTVETFEYDPLGDLVRMTWPHGDIVFDRDAVGRVVREVQVIDGEEHSVEVTLDACGARVRRATSLDHTEDVKRDAFGARRRTILDGSHTIEHTTDLLGREIVALLTGGGRIETAYDLAGRVARRWSTSPAARRPVRPEEPEWIHGQPDRVEIDKRYRYDPSRELIEAWDRRRGGTSYRYDLAGRLRAAVEERGGRWLFRYDAASNLHEADPGVEPREYGPGGRLLRKGDTRYAWDDDGRLIEKTVRREDGREKVWRYAWDAAGQLASVECPDGTLVRLSYDPLSRRVGKRVFTADARGRHAAPVEHTRFVWDGDVLVHEIRQRAVADGDPIIEERTYCFEDDRFIPRAHRDTRGDGLGGIEHTWYCYVSDPIGTPKELIADDGRPVGRLRHAPWGQAEVDECARTATTIRFQGQFEDVEISLHYNRFRYYDPDTGSYVSPDLLGLEAGIRSFGYGINPLRWVDPLGLTTGVVYLRRDPFTRRDYVGEAEDPTDYKARQRRHNGRLRKQCGNPLAKYEFFVLQDGVNPGPDLRQAEEDWIRAGGGPGVLENRIHAQSRRNYRGTVPFP